MSFKFACPHCGQRIGATEADVGTLGGCPRCEQQFVVPSPPEPSAPAPGPITTGESEVVPAPEVEPVTKRGAAIAALILSIFPVINLIALGLAIYAVVRSDRPGRSGERGLAIAAVVISGLLLIPVNVGGFVAATSPLLFKSAMMRPDVKTTAATPSPAAVKH